MRKQETSGTEILLNLILIPTSITINAWVVTVLWSWFVVTLWLGAPALTLAHAVGFGCLIGMYRSIHHKGEPISTPAWFFTSIARGLLMLGVGWIAKQFIGG